MADDTHPVYALCFLCMYWDPQVRRHLSLEFSISEVGLGDYVALLFHLNIVKFAQAFTCGLCLYLLYYYI